MLGDEEPGSLLPIGLGCEVDEVERYRPGKINDLEQFVALDGETRPQRLVPPDDFRKRLFHRGALERPAQT